LTGLAVLTMYMYTGLRRTDEKTKRRTAISRCTWLRTQTRDKHLRIL